MERIIAFCGLDCSVCPAYAATVNNDDAARAKVAEQWGKEPYCASETLLQTQALYLSTV